MKENILPVLTEQQKRIVIIASAALALLIPIPRNKIIFERVKAPGLSDHKWIHISSIDPFTIV